MEAPNSAPPSLQPDDFGWEKDEVNQGLDPITLPKSEKFLPDEIVQLIQCNCKSASPCQSRRCSCVKNDSLCTVLCGCAEDVCCNRNDMKIEEDASTESSSDEEI